MVLQLSLFIFALPPFRTGLWLQTEPVEQAYLMLAALQAAWCVWGIWKNRLQAVYYSHPLWWGLHAWVFWQIAMLPFAESAWRSWFGYPAHAIGVAWHGAVWLTALMGFALWRNPFARRIIVNACIGLAAVQVSMFALLGEHTSFASWLPATFGGYLAHMAAWVWIIYALHKRTMCYRDIFFMAVFVALAIYASQLRAAVLLILPALLVCYIAREFSSTRLFSGVLTRWRAASVFAVLGIAVIWNVMALQPSLFPDKRGSMAIRAAMHEIGVQTISDKPLRLMVGEGWGIFLSDNFRYALTKGTHLYKDGIFDSYAPLHENPSFHSHDQALEALLALGVVGLVLWFLFPLSVICTLPRQYFWQVIPVLCAVIVMSFLWFYFPVQLAYVALGYGAFAHACLRGAPRKVLSSQWCLLLMFVVTVVMAVSSALHYDAMRYGKNLMQAAFNEPAQNYPEDWIEKDIARGSDRLAFILQQQLQARDIRKLATDNDIQWKNQLLGALKTMAYDERSSAIYIAVELALQKQLSDGDFTATAPLRVGTSAWKAAVLHAARIAPRRDDLSTPFLQAVDNSSLGTEDKIAIYEELLAVVPTHRPARWLTIKESLANITIDNDRALLKQKAFDLLHQGLSDVYPISPERI